MRRKTKLVVIFRMYISRIYLLLRLEFGSLRYPRTIRRSIILSFPLRILGILRGNTSFNWAGIKFTAESKFESMLMHVHQHLVNQLQQDCMLPEGGAILDVGAHTGQFSACLLSIRPDLSVVSLEPNPTTFPLAQLNSRLRQELGSKWSTFPVGFDLETGLKQLHFVAGRSGQGSIYAENANLNMIGGSSNKVVSIDAQFINASGLTHLLDHPVDCWSLIKVDVEGHEAVIIPELSKLRFNFILMEIGTSRVGASSPSEVIELFGRHGRRIRLVNLYGDSQSETFDALFQNEHTSSA